jgi:diguanylate cyclase (GGDEF)-like protein
VFDWINRSVARRIALWAGLATGMLATALWPVLLRWTLVGESAAFRHRALLVVTGCAALMVIGVTTAVILTVRGLLGVPLQRLTEGMREAEKGNFLIRAQADRPDEIGQLGGSFNALLRTITDQQVDIIDTGRELTMTRRELELNRELEEKAHIIAEQNTKLGTQLRELELLYETTKTITSQLELPRLLESLSEQVGQTLGFEEFAIILMDEPSGKLVVRATYGLPNGDTIRGMAFDPGEGISGIVARTGEWLLIPDTSKDERYLHYKGQHLADGSFLCVPIRYQERLVGLFNVLRPRVDAFNEEEIRILISLANTAALAIANAQLFDRLATLSLTDELTGLSNRRDLTQRAASELASAQRHTDPLAVLMVDIDHFKQYNDAHGHLRGDEVLRDVARALRGTVRAIDTVARYGGEEFVVMLPRVGKADGALVAEKLRTAVAALALPGSELLPHGRVTVSVGVAAFPEDAREVSLLLEAADRALLRAKRAGRNRVIAFGPAAADEGARALTTSG